MALRTIRGRVQVLGPAIKQTTPIQLDPAAHEGAIIYVDDAQPIRYSDGTNWNAVGPGPQGLQGSQGIQGEQGTQGIQGIQGEQGTQGIQGEQGTQGIQGIQGNFGPSIRIIGQVDDASANTDPGDLDDYLSSLFPGANVGDVIIDQLFDEMWAYIGGGDWINIGPFRGNQGIQGLQGDLGFQGIQGFQGEQGTQGLQGNLGFQGIQGIQSTQGIQGIQGNFGPSIRIIGQVDDASANTDSGDLDDYFSSLFPAAGVGDVIIDQLFDEMWAYIGSGDWINIGPLRGEQGIQGIQGDVGIQGSTTDINATNDTTTTTLYPVLVQEAGSDQTAKVTTSKLFFDASTGTLSATEINSLSDETLKENMTPIQNALDIIKSLEGIQFNWIDNSKTSYGLSAQRVEEIIPELVATNGYKSVNYSGLIAFLIEAIKILNDKIENKQ